jgi:hypothetical protein
MPRGGVMLRGTRAGHRTRDGEHDDRRRCGSEAIACGHEVHLLSLGVASF